MNKHLIREVDHQPIEPVIIERDANDVVIIEGVRYAGDYFRTLAVPDPTVLYAVRRDGDQVWLTTIRNAKDALSFFVERDVEKQLSTGQGNSAPTDGGA